MGTWLTLEETAERVNAPETWVLAKPGCGRPVKVSPRKRPHTGFAERKHGEVERHAGTRNPEKWGSRSSRSPVP